MRCLMMLIALCVAACPARADLEIQFNLVDNSDVESLEGYVTQDLVVSTTTDWLTAQIILTVDEPPKIYQDAFGSQQSPNPAWFDIVPSLQYDTYISSGTLGETCSTAAASALGGTAVVFDEAELSIAWWTTNTDEIGDLALARITLDGTATGSWAFQVTAAPAPGPKLITSGQVLDGIIYLAGDVSMDRFVGQGDLDLVLDSWGQTVAVGSQADPSEDGYVGQADLDLVLRDWGYGQLIPEGAGATVPEPVSTVTIALGLLVLLRRPGARRH